MSETPPARSVLTRSTRLITLAVGVVIGLTIFAYSRKIWPFEVRREKGEIAAVLDGGYKAQPRFHKAMNLVAVHPSVAAALGEPVWEEGLERYQPVLQSAGTRYDYEIRLEGPKGEGIANVSVEELGSQQTVVWAVFTGPSGQPQNLLAAPPP